MKLSDTVWRPSGGPPGGRLEVRRTAERSGGRLEVGRTAGRSGGRREVWRSPGGGKDCQEVGRLPGGQEDCREVGRLPGGCEDRRREVQWSSHRPEIVDVGISFVGRSNKDLWSMLMLALLEGPMKFLPIRRNKILKKKSFQRKSFKKKVSEFWCYFVVIVV